MDPHTVRGGQQRQVFVDDRLDRRDVVDSVFQRIGGLFEGRQRVQVFAGAFFEGIEFPEKLLAQFLVGFGQQFFMGFPAFFLEFRVEIVRV